MKQGSPEARAIVAMLLRRVRQIRHERRAEVRAPWPRFLMLAAAFNEAYNAARLARRILRGKL